MLPTPGASADDLPTAAQQANLSPASEWADETWWTTSPLRLSGKVVTVDF